MLLNTLIYHINKACDENDLVTARSFIEKDFNRLTEPKNYRNLKSNAKDLLAIVISEMSVDGKLKFTRQEQAVAYAINKNSSNFDLSTLQRLVRDYDYVLGKEGFQYLLNNDAKIILESMGAMLGIKNAKTEV